MGEREDSSKKKTEDRIEHYEGEIGTPWSKQNESLVVGVVHDSRLPVVSDFEIKQIELISHTIAFHE